MGKRSPQTFAKLQREQAQREKRELKQTKKDARTEARRATDDPTLGEADPQPTSHR